MANAIEITGSKILRVREVRKGIPYGDLTKMKGQFYTQFTYEGVVFTVNDNDPFIKDRAAGNVHTIFFLESDREIQDADGNPAGTVRSLQFDGYASNAQMIGLTKTEAVLQSIMKGSFKAEAELSEADLQALEQ